MRPIITVKNVSKSYGLQAVLQSASFVLHEREKTALVGPNGAGKSTLLKLLSGREIVDEGVIELERGIRVGYLPQEMDTQGAQTVKEYFAKQETTSLKIFMKGFGIERLAPETELKKLSGGEKGKLLLIALLLEDADVLLLDEPTNNLDLPALIWLEEYLKNSEKTCLIVSHDRRFLDEVTGRVLEIDREKKNLNEYLGNYSDYLIQKEKELEKRKAEFERHIKKKRQLRVAIEEKKMRVARNIKKGMPDKDKMASGYHQNRAEQKLAAQTKALETRIRMLGELEKPVVRPPLVIELDPAAARAKHSVILNKVAFGFDSRFPNPEVKAASTPGLRQFYLGPIDLEIPFGRRVAILGKNGSGKTTLLRLISGEVPPQEGEYYAGPSLKFGNLTQAHENLPKEKSTYEFLEEETKLERQFIFNLLRKYNFSPDEAKKPISLLSPGGRARLLIAYFAARSVNVLILDEPTNHLDEEALNALENVLETYEGTVALVSHDRYFLERTKIDYWYALEGGQLKQIPDLASYEFRIAGEVKKTLALLKKTQS